MLKAARSAVFFTVLATSLAIPLATYSMAPGETVVTAVTETHAVSNRSDAADDIAIWVHPEDPAQSVIIGTDKQGGFVLYDLGGTTLQYLPVGKVNNVDLRYDFPLAGSHVDIVAASDRTRNAIAVYKVDPANRTLENIGGAGIDVDVTAYGFCMYRSSLSGKFYAFMIGKRGNIEQWELRDNGAGEVAGTLVREIEVPSQAEGCVADDELGHLYVGEERAGIWKFGAEPSAGSGPGLLIDSTQRSGNLTDDVEGLSLYYGTDGLGYLLASSQGSDEFIVYDRAGDNAFVMRFRISDGVVDGVTGTDGIDVLGFGLGPRFPNGVFVAQDDKNSDEATGSRANQNFKLVPWEAIANADVMNPLIINNSVDPRDFRRR